MVAFTLSTVSATLLTVAAAMQGPHVPMSQKLQRPPPPVPSRGAAAVPVAEAAGVGVA